MITPGVGLAELFAMSASVIHLDMKSTIKHHCNNVIVWHSKFMQNLISIAGICLMTIIPPTTFFVRYVMHYKKIYLEPATIRTQLAPECVAGPSEVKFNFT